VPHTDAPPPGPDEDLDRAAALGRAQAPGGAVEPQLRDRALHALDRAHAPERRHIRHRVGVAGGVKSRPVIRVDLRQKILNPFGGPPPRRILGQALDDVAQRQPSGWKRRQGPRVPDEIGRGAHRGDDRRRPGVARVQRMRVGALGRRRVAQPRRDQK